MQVAPDGNSFAFITSSQVTTYDNQGHSEMYLYRPGENRVDCASCRPDGSPPTADTWGSQNGLFLTDDGRAFFSTNDAVVVQDTNEANDVYEFVEGKPQLITSGIGPTFSGFAGFQGYQNGPGLVSVSADGIDVYFATYETLVTQDHNGAGNQDLRRPQQRRLPGRTAEGRVRSRGRVPRRRQRPAGAADGPLQRPARRQPEADRSRRRAPKKKHKKKKHKKAHKKAQSTKRGGRHAG